MLGLSGCPISMIRGARVSGGTGLIYGSLTANKNDLYLLSTPNSKSLKI